MSVLATIGALDTGAITLKRWGVLGPLICPGGAEACDKVLNSVWGSLFGQPLSLFGFLAYAAVLLLSLLPLVLQGDLRRELLSRSRWALFLLTAGMAVFSLVLMAVMLFKIKAVCAFCISTASTPLTLLAIAIAAASAAMSKPAMAFSSACVAAKRSASSCLRRASVASALSTAALPLGAVGFCFGGHLAWQLAALPALQATCAFYGAGPPLAVAPHIPGRLWTFCGDQDPLMPAPELAAIAEALAAADTLGQRHRYLLAPGAGHGYLCDQRADFHPEAAAEGGRQMGELFSSMPLP
jgi:uncharacterized membrane protein